jgi:lipoprotein-anchoring transpeptidase ErfK/SrfK
MRARYLLAALAASLLLGAAAGAAGAAPAPRAAQAKVPVPPTSRLAWVARPLTRTVARAAPRRSAKAKAVVKPNAPVYGGATQLLVTRTHVVDGERWLEVLLPVRPNGTRGWIRADVTRLSTTTLRIVISLSARRLILYRANRIVLRTRVAIGASGTPTPQGRLFAVAERIPTNVPRGFLGPFVFPLTGYSETLNEFAGGNGRVAIHGTSLPELIGTRASHGCIRVRNADVVRLSRLVRAGTPVAIRR